MAALDSSQKPSAAATAATAALLPAARMTTNNPRKFKDRIALLNQKQAEGTAQFQAVMREVSEVKKPQQLAGLDVHGMVAAGHMAAAAAAAGVGGGMSGTDGLMMQRQLSPTLPTHSHFARWI